MQKNEKTTWYPKTRQKLELLSNSYPKITIIYANSLARMGKTSLPDPPIDQSTDGKHPSRYRRIGAPEGGRMVEETHRQPNSRLEAEQIK